MKLLLTTTPNTEPVPFNHNYQMLGAIHKWLGQNNSEHDGMSLYSFGRLRKGRNVNNRNLDFPQGATFLISFWNDDSAKQLITGILKMPEFMYGMKVYDIRPIQPPTFHELHRFEVDSPILVRKKLETGRRKYFLWHEVESNEILTANLVKKLKKAGFEDLDSNIRVAFDTTYHKPKAVTLKLNKEVKHKGSICPVIIAGTPETLRFAWLVGLGHLTGSGFGALK